MSWTAVAQRRAVGHVFTGVREFVLIRGDGTEIAGRVAGPLSAPVAQGDAWRCTNEGIIEFPPFARTEAAEAVGIAVYDGSERLATVPMGAVAVAERVQVVLRPRDLWVGVSQ